MPWSQAISAMSHDANKGGHEDARDGGQHVGQRHQGAREVWGEVSLVGEHPREHAREKFCVMYHLKMCDP